VAVVQTSHVFLTLTRLSDPRGSSMETKHARLLLYISSI